MNYPPFALLRAADECHYLFEILPDICFIAAREYLIMIMDGPNFGKHACMWGLDKLEWKEDALVFDRNLQVHEVWREHVGQIVRDV